MSRYWTHPSVQLFTSDENPVIKITQKARNLVYEAIQKGWQGPPFDPFDIAEMLKIDVVPSENIPDAKIIIQFININ